MGGYQTRQLRIEASKSQDTLFTIDFDTNDVAGVLLFIDSTQGVYSYPTETRDGYTRHNILIPHELIRPHPVNDTIPAELWEYDHEHTQRVVWKGFIEVTD